MTVNQVEKDRKARLIEVGLSVLASAAMSAVVAAWTMSATLATFKAKLDEHDRALEFKQQQVSILEGRQAVLEGKQQAADAHYQDILRRLDSIDRKLDEQRR